MYCLSGCYVMGTLPPLFSQPLQSSAGVLGFSKVLYGNGGPKKQGSGNSWNPLSAEDAPEEERTKHHHTKLPNWFPGVSKITCRWSQKGAHLALTVHLKLAFGLSSAKSNLLNVFTTSGTKMQTKVKPSKIYQIALLMFSEMHTQLECVRMPMQFAGVCLEVAALHLRGLTDREPVPSPQSSSQPLKLTPWPPSSSG